MDPIRSILRNSAVLMAAKVVSAAIGLALVAVLPRLLGDVEYGRFHLALALVGMVSVAIDLGLTQVLARDVARDHALARAYLWRAATVTVAAGFLFYGGLAALLTIAGYPAGTDVVVAILAVSMVLDALTELSTGLFQGHERMVVPAVARIAGNAITLGALLPWLWAGTPVGAAAVAKVLVASSLIRLALQAWGLRGLEGIRAPRRAAVGWGTLLAAGLPFVLWQALGVVYFRVDVIMLGWMTPAATVGWYGAASRLVDGLTFIADVIAVTSFPVLARLWTQSPAEFRQVARRTLDLIAVVALPLVLVLLVLAPHVVETLFSAEFVNTTPILRIHAITLGLLFLDYFLATVLMAIGRERAWLVISVLACIVNPVLNLAAIRITAERYGNGGIGAALATMATEACVAACALGLVPRGAFGRLAPGQVARLAVAGAAMTGVMGVTLLFPAPWILAGGLGGLVYLGLILRLGLVPEDVQSGVRALLPTRLAREVLS